MNDIPDYDHKAGEWLARPIVVLDTAGLTDNQRREGSGLMGGSSATWVDATEAVDRMHEVTRIVVRWGDPELSTWLARMHEHGAPVHSEHELLDVRTVPISAIIGNMVFTLTIQTNAADLREAQRRFPDHFMNLDWDETTAIRQISQHATLPIPRPELLVEHDRYLLALGIGTSLVEDC